jgi:hypothetical protein
MIDYGTLLRDHVTLRCRSIDRIFLQAYVPRLQAVGEVCTFLRWQRKFPIPSSAAFGRIGDEYVKALYRFAEANGIPVVHFKKGQNKEEVARPYLEAAAKGGKERVVMIGIAQEKASVWRSWPRKGQEKARHPHMDWGREMAFINHFYFYLWDSEWGAAFWKTNAYAPFPIWLWLNGHEWAKRQLDKAGIGYEALDNGFRSCSNAAGLHKILRWTRSSRGAKLFRALVPAFALGLHRGRPAGRIRIRNGVPPVRNFRYLGVRPAAGGPDVV